MTRYVIDASAAVEYLLKTPLGLTVANLIRNASLFTPELLDAEVLSALRRGVLHGHIEEARARMCIEALTIWPVVRIPLRRLSTSAWAYHRNITTYDAFYVALSRAYNVPLITTDGRLARAPSLNIAVQHLSLHR